MDHKYTFLLILVISYSKAAETSQLATFEKKIDNITNELKKIENELISMNRSHENSFGTISGTLNSINTTLLKMTEKSSTPNTPIAIIPSSSIPPLQVPPSNQPLPKMPNKY